MSALPLRATPPSRVGAVRSQAQQRHQRQRGATTKATLSGTPWRNNGSCRVDESSFEKVLKWVESNGGYVHPSLCIGYSVATGTRGIIAKSAVLEADMRIGPLIAVPDCLRISAATSLLRLRPIVDLCDLPPLEKFSDHIQTSLLLAFERRKGSDSFWASYIETLPESPSCAWLLPEKDLRIEIALLPSHIKGSDNCLDMARYQAEHYHQEIREAIEDYGDALGLDSEDLTWALGHVQSRAYGEECSLIPIIDLVNHNAQAMPPLRLMSDDGVPMTYVGSFYYGIHRPLQPGDELFVNYQFPTTASPLALFLDIGFLPQEFMHEEGHLSPLPKNGIGNKNGKVSKTSRGTYMTRLAPERGSFVREQMMDYS